MSFIFQSKSVIFSEIEIIIRTYIRGRFKEEADSEKPYRFNHICLSKIYPIDFVEDDIVLDKGKARKEAARLNKSRSLSDIY